MYHEIQILDQIQKSGALREAEDALYAEEVEKAASIAKWWNRMRGRQIGKHGIENVSNFLGRSTKSKVNALKSGIQGPLPGVSPRDMEIGREALDYAKLQSAIPTKPSSFMTGFEQFAAGGSGRKTSDIMEEISRHGQNKRFWKPSTWGYGNLSQEARRGMDYLQQARKAGHLPQDFIQRKVSDAAWAGAPDAAVGAHRAEGIRRATGLDIANVNPKGAPAAGGGGADININLKGGKSKVPDAKTPIGPEESIPLSGKTTEQMAEEAAKFTNAKAQSIGDVWATFQKGGWGGLTPQQQRKLKTYGAGAFMLKDPALNFLGVNQNRG